MIDIDPLGELARKSNLPAADRRRFAFFYISYYRFRTPRDYSLIPLHQNSCY